MHTKIITLLIVGAVAFTATVAFATKNYNSSKSNTSSIGKINEQVGNILLRYSVGGAEINRVTDALARGINEVDLKTMLRNIAIPDDQAEKILLEFDGMGIGINEEGIQSISAPSAVGVSPSAAEGTIKEILPSKRAEPAPVTTPQQEVRTGFKSVDGLDSETEIIEIKDGDDMTIRKRPGLTKYSNVVVKREAFHRAATDFTENMKAAESTEQRQKVIRDNQSGRQMFQESIQTLHQNLRENAKVLRDNFRKNISIIVMDGSGGDGVTRIAVAHGEGLRMLHRFRSAKARFDHILGRLESRIEKIGIKIEAQARAKGKITSLFPPTSVILLIEEAKNMRVENEAKMELLKEKYESLLLGENVKGISEEARAIAKELKTEIENLHAKLREIATAIRKGVGEIEIEIRSEDAT